MIVLMSWELAVQKFNSTKHMCHKQQNIAKYKNTAEIKNRAAVSTELNTTTRGKMHKRGVKKNKGFLIVVTAHFSVVIGQLWKCKDCGEKAPCLITCA